ncbi:hypothetical protein CWC25_20145 [Pseudoalteromonas sp. S4389]|uniref:KAP family NTPase n=1 Tax=Pseudoalteromonas sp. S4389 TaxID=579556 RepID=UPI001109C4F6|nr:P-loop NTPase fold protein [Pseudoalteromonas sp. S4389]TMO40562.1 hypothetical protein CWC25_20145 [Pseudoalteromonas sp. S4389]
MTTEEYNLSSDKPLNDIEQDVLGYSKFATNLARCITAGTFDDGIVFSLYAEWGAGKSTTLSFLESEIKNQAPDIEILHFNPWWFSGEDALLKSFFTQLRALFSNWQSKGKSIAKKLGVISEVLAKAPIAEAKAVDALIKKLLGTDLNQLKKEIELLLRQEQKKIVVIIDDIDRLTGEEVKQLFKLVKAVANFPNIAYLLAFDRKVVASSIEKSLNVNGSDYIEKIVQVPFELPPPDPSGLTDLFISKINYIFRNVPEKEHDQTHFVNIYHDGIKYFLKTPRDVIRLSNSLSITYKGVEGEVNFCDFTAIETLRVFEPKIYDFIRRNEYLFSGVERNYGYSRDDKQLELKRNKLNTLFEMAEKVPSKVIKDLLLRIFPKVSSITGNIMYGSDHSPYWRKGKHICAPELFNVYFQFSLPSSIVSSNEVEAVVEATSTQSDLEKVILKLSIEVLANNRTKLSSVLERLVDYLADLEKQQVINIINMIFNIGDKLLIESDESEGMLAFGGNNLRLGRLMFSGIKQLTNDKAERFNVLKAAFENGEGIVTMADQATILGQEHGKYSYDEGVRDDSLIELKHQERLEQIVLSRIRADVNAGLLELNNNSVNLIYDWARWADNEEITLWLKEQLRKEPMKILFLLKGFCTKSYSHSGNDRIARKNERLNVKNLSEFLDIEEAKEIATGIFEHTDELDKELIKLFFSECDLFESDPNTFDRH